MRWFRHLALFLVLFYAAFVVGTSLHSHSGKDPASPDCKLCQVSHLSLIQTVETSCSPVVSNFGIYDETLAVLVLQDSTRIAFGRAPPAA